MTEKFEVQIWIDAIPDRVFPYFVEPDKISQWLSKSAATNLVVGGEMKMIAKNDAVAIGEFLVIDPPRQVKFTWGWVNRTEVPPGSTTVDIKLEAENGGTRVTLCHSDLPTEGWATRHQTHWAMYLEDLNRMLCSTPSQAEQTRSA